MKEKANVAEYVQEKLSDKQKLIRVAAGLEPADYVLKNATYLNVFSNEFSHGDIAVSGELIAGIGSYNGRIEIDVSDKFVCPGFIDAHIHLESSLVSPEEFAKAVVRHGTTTVITDPHEITNVMGLDGLKYMLEATVDLPIGVHFMLPSCVPATPLDESGSKLDFLDIDPFYDHPKVLGLAEMMNFVGVINGDEDCISKILGSQSHHKKIDGHAPDLSGKELNAYLAAGVYSDHECYSYKNALEKLQKGQFIMIREGTAAHNLKSLLPLLNQQYYSRCMFATDDKHPNDLLERGHIDYIVKESIKNGVDPIIAINTASHNAARYFLLNNKGAIAPGYKADMIIFDNFIDFNIEKVMKRGKIAYENGEVLPFKAPNISLELKGHAINTFHVETIKAKDLCIDDAAVVGMVKGEIITQNCGRATCVSVKNDILKIAVVERHKSTGHIGLGFIKGYGLKKGAVATSISHDSHNIIAVGVTDEDMAVAINAVVDNKGGIVVVSEGKVLSVVKLEIAGLMSNTPLEKMNDLLEEAKKTAYSLGVAKGIDPFMSLSFMSLPVIPSLRVTTRGVFDVEKWKYI